MNRVEQFRASMTEASNRFVDVMCDLFAQTLDDIVQGAVASLHAPPMAVLDPDPAGGFRMTLPDGQLWHATRARDLRRKARHKGIAWQERGI